jgi:hypothetical protein
MTRSLSLAFAVSLAVFAGACSSSTTTSPSPNPTPQGGKSMVRVVHASPDAPAVDVWAKGVATPLLTNVKYGDASKYLELAEGSYEIELRPAGAAGNTPPAFSTGPLAIPANAKITAVAAGLLSSTKDEDKFRVLPVVEGWAKESGKASVRIVHASADAPAVGIDVGADDPSKPEIASLARFADTGAAGVALPAGQKLQVGIAAGGQTVTAFTTPELPAGGEILVIATGLLGKLARESQGFSLLAVGPDGAIGFVKQNPRVYALHASPDAPAVDLFAGDVELSDNLGFGKLSGSIQVPPGAYNLDFFAHAAGSARPQGSAAASAMTPSLAAGEQYLAIATGFLAGGTQKFQLAAFQEGFALDDAKNARIRVIHASPDAPAVDVGVAGQSAISPVVVPNLAFPSATSPEGLSLAPGMTPLGITPTGQSSSIVARFDVTKTAGLRAFAVAAGALDGSKGEDFRLLLVDTSKSPWVSAEVMPK